VYEFNEDEDEVIARLAVSMSNVGFLSLFGGMLTLLKVLFISVLAVMIGYVALGMLSIVSCVLQLTIAGMMIGAGRVLLGIVRTEGDDMAILMRGLGRITTIFVLEIIVTIIALGFVVWIGVAS
jgi:hypothetical protein